MDKKIDDYTLVQYGYLLNLLKRSDVPQKSLLIVGNNEDINQQHYADYNTVKRLDEAVYDLRIATSDKPTMFTAKAVEDMLEDLLTIISENEKNKTNVYCLSKINKFINGMKYSFNKKPKFC